MINLKNFPLKLGCIIISIFILSPRLSDSADSASGFPWTFLLLGVTIVLVLMTYSLYSENRKLKSELIRYADIIKKQATERKIRDSMSQQKNATLVQTQPDKLDKISEIRKEQMKKRFWDKLEKSFEPEVEQELEKLIAEKKRLDEMIELTKSKYHRREIDESGFKNIITEYQKQLIDIESRIKKFEENQNG